MKAEKNTMNFKVFAAIKITLNILYMLESWQVYITLIRIKFLCMVYTRSGCKETREPLFLRWPFKKTTSVDSFIMAQDCTIADLAKQIARLSEQMSKVMYWMEDQSRNDSDKSSTETNRSPRTNFKKKKKSNLSRKRKKRDIQDLSR